MKRGLTGEHVTISSVGDEICRAFLPRALPPEPSLQISEDLQVLLDEGLLALGRLDSISDLLPDTSLFLYMYVRKEAVLSSQIEGTQSSLSDLLLFESDQAPGVPLDDVQEVSCYVAALNHGMTRITEGFPLCSRLLREMHAVLLSKGRGSEKEPGEFRASQNWIGGTRPGNARYVPPPHDRVNECMNALEKFIHNDPVRTPVLIKAALAHVQFETIHPFLDGNGRLGRLLIPLLLCAEGALKHPMLYLSLYFKTHREEYYDLLQSVRIDGDWEEWIHFFVEGVKETAAQAVETARALLALFNDDRQRIQTLGKGAGSALRVHHAMQKAPLLTIRNAARATGLSTPAVSASLNRLAELGVLTELTGRQRGRLYAYSRYLEVLGERAE